MTEVQRVLGGRYALGSRLGVGGMAEVYLGEDTRLGRQVAVKVLRADLARDPAFHTRFRREAQAAASLNAPTIVSVYDTGEDDDGGGTAIPWIVMELIDGRTLREVLQQEGRLLPRRALELVADVCTALQVAHDSGIVHRDIKPANVMLTPQGDVKVMDFGIARAAAASAHTMTATAAVLGTAAYLSPEQARGEHVDARSDLYSTGCLLYELLTGSPPFRGDNPISVAYQHVREDPRPPSEWDVDLGADVDAVVLKAMAKNPANRYQSAREMGADLRRAARGATVQATPLLVAETQADEDPAADRPTEPDRRTRTLVYSALALLLVALAAVVALGTRSLLSNQTGLVPAPGIVGQSQAGAQASLAEKGLTVGQVNRQFSAQPVGTVLSQNPVGNILVDEGGAVDVTVSQGVQQTVVPAVVGLSQAEATAQVEASQLKVAGLLKRDGNVTPGQVLAVIPAAGTTLAIDKSVQLVVSSGVVAVPTVVGRSQAEALAGLQAAGLNVGVMLVANTGPPGRVLTQQPQGRAMVQRGTDVIIAVSQPPPTPAPSPAPTVGPSATATAPAMPSPGVTPP